LPLFHPNPQVKLIEVMKNIILLMLALVATTTASSQIDFIAELDTKLDSCTITIDYFDVEADSLVHAEIHGKGKWNKFRIYGIDCELVVQVKGVNEAGVWLCKTTTFKETKKKEAPRLFSAKLGMNKADADVELIDGNIKITFVESVFCY